MTDTASATTAVKVPKGKRVPGPVSFKYLNEKGETATKMPTDVAGLVAVDASGKELNIALDLSPAIMRQLAIHALVKKADIFVRNSFDKENPGNVLDLVSKIVTDIKSGVKTKEAAKGAAGRKFDPEFWITVIKNMAATKGVQAPEAKLNDARAKLEAATPSERKDIIKAWEKNEAFKIEVIKLRALNSKKEKPADDMSEFF